MHIDNKNLLDTLNCKQIEAVTHQNGPMLILAGAGSGKTTVITHRIAWLIKQLKISPNTILAMTFTNKAAREMKERIKQFLNIPTEELWITTFHQFCTRILRIMGDQLPIGRNFTIFDKTDQNYVIQEILKKNNSKEKYLNSKKIIEMISHFKNNCLLPNEIENFYKEIQIKQITNIYNNYQEYLINNHACDFDDLILYTERLLRNHNIQIHWAEKFNYILIDEYQDTNKAQYSIIKHLSKYNNNVCAVGDEDQSIYAWRGADINNILHFQRDFPYSIQIKLEQNYRSTQNILYAANTVISNNNQRLEKFMWTNNQHGEKITFKLFNDSRLEAKYIVNQIKIEQNNRNNIEIAILYRSNWQSRQVEEELRNNNINYKLTGGTKFYERQEIKDIIAYIRLINNPLDLISFRRSITTPTRGIGPITISKIEQAIPKNGTTLDGINIILKDKQTKGKIRDSLLQYYNLLNKTITKQSSMTISNLLHWIISESGYKKMLLNDNTLESQNRLNNLEELILSAKEAEENGIDLTEYLERITLISNQNNLEQANSVSLMTIHCSKGLEFPIIFLTGMEDGTFPIYSNKKMNHNLEEERRLFYVAITRAQKILYLTAVRSRYKQGQNISCNPSKFLYELPNDSLHKPINWNIDIQNNTNT